MLSNPSIASIGVDRIKADSELVIERCCMTLAELTLDFRLPENRARGFSMPPLVFLLKPVLWRAKRKFNERPDRGEVTR